MRRGRNSRGRSALLASLPEFPCWNHRKLWKNNAKVPMQHLMESIFLDDLGAVRITGADAQRFLQGQVSADVTQLSPGRALLAGYHNPQGRAIALLRLILVAPNDVLAVLPRELATVVARRLAKFILRAKVKLDDVSGSFNIHGLVAEDDSQPPAPGADSMLVRVADAPARWLHISPADAQNASGGDRQRWRAFDIAGGEPQVYAATSEEFIAQMLNLDALGAIAFDKGCYTGQEVIARAHYRGRVKRRMQRFVTHVSQELTAGTAGRLVDGRSFKVVDAVKRADGACEFLAVTALGARDEAQPDSATPSIEAKALPLPYSLPE
jgi:tRNA-modifying protein YgfZ